MGGDGRSTEYTSNLIRSEWGEGQRNKGFEERQIDRDIYEERER